MAEKGKVKVKPNALWPIATAGEVKIRGESIEPPVPIVVIRICPAKVTVQRKQYPTGVVIFNENPMENDVIPKNLEHRYTTEKEEVVDLPGTEQEPYGVVVIFAKGHSESV